MQPPLDDIRPEDDAESRRSFDFSAYSKINHGYCLRETRIRCAQAVPKGFCGRGDMSQNGVFILEHPLGFQAGADS